MPKRRAGSPDTEIDRPRKRLSLTALAAKASSSSLRMEQQGSFLNNIFTSHSRLRRSSTVSLRPTPRPALRPAAALQPGLTVSGRSLQTHPDHDVASITELLVFPTSLAMIKPQWIFPYTVNCTPQLGPPLPEHVEDLLFQKYVGSRMHPRPQQLPYLHLGSTALGFRVDFYLLLPGAETAAGHSGTGNMCYEDLQAVYDLCIRPALETAYPRRHRWVSWMDAKNESHLKPLKSRRRSARSEPQEERMHCEGLQTLWEAIEVFAEHHRIAHIMRGKQLVAYGDVEVHDWQPDWRPTWAQFTQLWHDGVNTNHVGSETKFTMEMNLGFDDMDFLRDFPVIPTRPRTPSYPGRPRTPSVRSATPDQHHRTTTPGPRSCTPVSRVYSPPPSAPPRMQLPPVPSLPDHIALPKRTSRRVSSRHSIRCVDPNMTDLPELSEME